MIKHDALIAKPRVYQPVCPYCGTKAWLNDGSALRRSKPVWLCGNYPECDSYVGCHPGIGNIPLGSLANRELRLQRMSVHDRIDQYWRFSDGRIKRKEVYALVAAVMRRKSFHAGTAREGDIQAFDAAWPQIQSAARQILDKPQIRLEAVTTTGPGPQQRLRVAVAAAQRRDAVR